MITNNPTILKAATQIVNLIPEITEDKDLLEIYRGIKGDKSKLKSIDKIEKSLEDKDE